MSVNDMVIIIWFKNTSGRSAHLGYRVHKSGRKTSIIIIIIIKNTSQ
jgi:hypothetical protein